ncbi:MAG: hypothetical protein NTV92_03225, partial [Candidatus Bipolaricaulota bacterium]|nr:hypothetical protein [Candidatus Bipolaricaulota bacterium]
LPTSGRSALANALEPLMSGSSALARALRPLVGSGPGAGIGLMFVLAGLVGAAAAVVGYLYRPVREIETLVPDVPPASVAPEAEG